MQPWICTILKITFPKYCPICKQREWATYVFALNLAHVHLMMTYTVWRRIPGPPSSRFLRVTLEAGREGLGTRLSTCTCTYKWGFVRTKSVITQHLSLSLTVTLSLSLSLSPYRSQCLCSLFQLFLLQRLKGGRWRRNSRCQRPITSATSMSNKSTSEEFNNLLLGQGFHRCTHKHSTLTATLVVVVAEVLFT